MSRIATIAGITRRYLHDEVAERLRELILSGELEPKSRVNEVELCARFGISRTPLREAIKILSTEGLLELLPNRGARVATVSEAEIDEMIEVVAGLEAMAGDLCCRVITDQDVAVIELKTAQMVRAYQANDEARYFTLNREIHEAIMAAARNATLTTLYANLTSRIQRMRYTAHKTPEQWQRAVDEHLRMVGHLREREGEKLARLMRDHVRSKKSVIAANYGD